MEFIKENKKLCIAILCIGILVLGVGSVVLQGVMHRGISRNVPESTLTTMPNALSDAFLNYKDLNMCVHCAGTDCALWVPADAHLEEDYIKASLNGVNIVVSVSDKSLGDMICDDIPRRLYVSVLGKKPKTDILLRDEGYFSVFPAQYAVSVFKAQISVRSVTCFVLTYALEVSEHRYIYLSVSSESEDMLEGGKKILDAVASSLRKYEDSSLDIQDAMFSDVVEEIESGKHDIAAHDIVKPSVNDDHEKTNPLADFASPDGKLDLYFQKKIDKATENGILVMMWENYTVEPVSLTVFGVDGGQVKPIMEECVPGFYAFEVGRAAAGKYLFKGTTDTELIDVYVDLYEADDYYRMYGAYDGD